MGKIDDWILEIKSNHMRDEKKKNDYPPIYEYLDRNYFTGIEDYKKDNPSTKLTETDFNGCKNGFVMRWLENTKLKLSEEERNLDDEQITAIATVGSDVLVTARAGSGKTRTLVTRALFLIDQCKVSPSEILLVVFNTKARYEIIDRIEKALGLDKLPHVMTFHGLAYAICEPPPQSLLPDDENDDRWKNFIKEAVKVRLSNDETLKKLWASLVKSHFSKNFEEIEGGHKKKKIVDPDQIYERFIKAIGGFISLARKGGVQPSEMAVKGNSNTTSQVELDFFQLAREVYEKYLESLAKYDRLDFDGLLANSPNHLAGNRKSFKYHITEEKDRKKRKKSDIQIEVNALKFVMIDEYQDFSKLFYELIYALRKRNQTFEAFCVGDDWQAINGFAGSDLQYFLGHPNYFKNKPVSLTIRTNYRSGASIVEYGNEIMKGFGAEAVASRSLGHGKAYLIDLDTFKSKSLIESYEYRIDKSLPSILRIMGKLLPSVLNKQDESKGFAFLSRTNYHVQFKKWYSDRLKKHFGEKAVKDLIDNQNVHQYKGKQKDHVVILDAVHKSFPLRHPDWIFTKPFGNTLQKMSEEERRLFYVAATRAKENLFVFTTKDSTQFLSENKLEAINWDEFPYIPAKEKESMIVVGNKDENVESTRLIKERLKVANYVYQGGQEDERLRNKWAKLIQADSIKLDDVVKNEPWTREGIPEGIEIRVYDYNELIRVDSGNVQNQRGGT